MDKETKENMETFFKQMVKRKKLGDKIYGEDSHRKLSIKKSISMAEEEAIDLANYSFFRWLKLQEVK